MSTVYSNGPSGRVNFSWIGESFNIYKRNAGTWILAMLISGVLGIVIALAFDSDEYMVVIPDLLHHIAPPSSTTGYSHSQFILNIINFVISSFFYTGLFKMANKAVRYEPITIGDLFSGINNYGSFLLFGIVFVIAMFAGVLMCCVGVFFVWFFFWPVYSLLAEGESVGSAIRRATAALQQDALNGAFFAFVLMLLVVVTSVLTCGLAGFVTTPMLYIVAALAVRDMLGPKFVDVVPTLGSWPPAPSTPGSQFSTPQPPPPPTKTERQFFTPAPPPPAVDETVNKSPIDDNDRKDDSI